LNLPVRTIHHGAISAYFIKLGTLLVGENALGFRLTSIVAGSATVVFTGLIGYRFFGKIAGIFAATLLAFNEYHIMISSIAVQKSFFLLFLSVSLYCFMRAIESDRPWDLMLAGLFAAFSFLTYEVAALLIPIFLLALISCGRINWLTRRSTYGTIVLGLAVVAVDLVQNLTITANDVGTLFDLAGRFSGLGLSLHHMTFFIRELMEPIYSIFNRAFVDNAPDYRAMNFVFGLLILASATLWAMLIATAGRNKIPKSCITPLIFFWFGFCFFLFIEPARQFGQVDWHWMDITLIPGVILTGALPAYLSNYNEVSNSHVVKSLPISLGLLALAISIVSFAFDNLGLPSHQVQIRPGYLHGKAGEIVKVHSQFNGCMTCDAESQYILMDIGILQNDNSVVSARGTDDVVDAEFNTEDYDFGLRVQETKGTTHYFKRIYVVTYEVISPSDKRSIITTWLRLAHRPDATKPFFFWMN
jgi:4-amino-4-deoxy-L-arabinose transferase-like glycosyltransferase